MEGFQIKKNNKNRFYKSYGLVIITRCPPDRVLLVERRIPYCLQNCLIKKIGVVASAIGHHFRHHDKNGKGGDDCDDSVDVTPLSSKNFTRSSCLRNNLGKEIQCDDFVRSAVARTLASCQRQMNLCQDVDFNRYLSGGAFEDQYDFPHGQMSAKTKRVLKELLVMLSKENVNSSVSDSNGESVVELEHPAYNFFEKVAGFLTAFMEFEEETGYTFRFDMQTMSKLREVSLTFVGLDEFLYEQKYFVLRVDKLEKLQRKRVCNSRFGSVKCRCCTPSSRTVEGAFPNVSHLTASDGSLEGNKKRREKISREIDKQIYVARLVKVEEAVLKLYRQQLELGKEDQKHKLPLLSSLNENDIFQNHEKETAETKKLESLFFDFVRRVDPDVFKRCVRRFDWREH